ncbi:MAG TPA: hypothetical protein VLZ83_07715 [Edaphocola sp.]|nr:hypothetical protein [Edaphocola sp.]
MPFKPVFIENSQSSSINSINGFCRDTCALLTRLVNYPNLEMANATASLATGSFEISLFKNTICSGFQSAFPFPAFSS